MSWISKLALVCIVFQIGLMGCDSTSTLEDPNSFYFLKFY